jgi:formiminotetrahydrofolate cyclodeaminase
VAAHGNRNAASDVGVASALLRAGLRGARLNIDININSVADAAYTTAVSAETVRLSEEAENAAGETEALVRHA